MFLKENSQMPCPSLGVDIDGCITDCPAFFSILTNNWPGKVYIITYRDNKKKAEELLKKYKIHWDTIILVNSFEAKAKVIKEEAISIFFDDQPEMLKNISSTCDVMLVRNEGNFDFKDKKWMLSNQTGKIV